MSQKSQSDSDNNDDDNDVSLEDVKNEMIMNDDNYIEIRMDINWCVSRARVHQGEDDADERTEKTEGGEGQEGRQAGGHQEVGLVYPDVSENSAEAASTNSEVPEPEVEEPDVSLVEGRRSVQGKREHRGQTRDPESSLGSEKI